MSLMWMLLSLFNNDATTVLLRAYNTRSCDTAFKMQRNCKMCMDGHSCTKRRQYDFVIVYDHEDAQSTD